MKEFIRNYLADQKYIAIMMRTEKLKKSILSESYGENKCLHDFLSDWNSTREKHHINQTLLFSDVGNKGSMKWNNQAAYNFSRYVQDTLRPKLTTDEINSHSGEQHWVWGSCAYSCHEPGDSSTGNVCDYGRWR